MNRNKWIAIQNELMEKHCEEVQNIYRQMRGWRHDYHNHIQTMKAYLALGKLGELEEYLGRLDEDLRAVDTLIKTGNVKADAILGSKLSLMASRGIRVSAKAAVPAELRVSDVDLCVILGNLLDNALESCARAQDPAPFIRIYLGVLKEQLYLSVSNTAGKKLNRLRNGRYPSSKPGAHGFGLARVDALVKKYGGTVNRQSEPGVFATEVLLPL